MEVWVAFGIGFFLGGFIGVLALSILFMARDDDRHQPLVGWMDLLCGFLRNYGTYKKYGFE